MLTALAAALAGYTSTARRPGDRWRCGSTTGWRTSGSGSSASRSRCCSPTATCPRHGGGRGRGWLRALRARRRRSRARRSRARHRGAAETAATPSRCPASPATSPPRKPSAPRCTSWVVAIGLVGARRADAALARRRAPAAQVVRLRRDAHARRAGARGGEPAGARAPRRHARHDRVGLVPHPRHLRPAAGHRRRDPPPPALRHRRRHQPHARLRRADRDARRHVPGARAADRAHARHVEPGDRGLDAGGRGAVPPVAGADPGRGRPALLPPPLRRGAHARGVRRPPA